MGVLTNYVAAPVGNATRLFTGVAGVVAAIVLCAVAYGKLPRKEDQKTVGKGLALSVAAGVLMGFFYRFVAVSMFDIQFAGGRLIVNAEPGKLSPYTALVVFSVGIFLSNFVWNSIVMARPFVGAPVPFSAYFTKGNLRLHSIG